MPVKLYAWTSDVMADFGSGQIIAAGRSIEEALKNARQMIESDEIFRFLPQYEGVDFHADLEELESKRQALIDEMHLKPTVYPTGMLIQGSA